MNGRQKELLNFLKAGDPGRYISKEEIVNSLQELYPRNLENTTDHNSTVYSRLREDIKEIRDDDSCDCIIISCSRGYKIARNYQEGHKYLNRYFGKTFRQLKRGWKLVDKIGANCQIRFDEEGNAELVEVYPNGNKDN